MFPNNAVSLYHLWNKFIYLFSKYYVIIQRRSMNYVSEFHTFQSIFKLGIVKLLILIQKNKLPNEDFNFSTKLTLRAVLRHKATWTELDVMFQHSVTEHVRLFSTSIRMYGNENKIRFYTWGGGVICEKKCYAEMNSARNSGICCKVFVNMSGRYPL